MTVEQAIDEVRRVGPLLLWPPVFATRFGIMAHRLRRL